MFEQNDRPDATSALTRRGLMLAAGIGLALPGSAFAATDYPQRPVQFLVPFTPGGGADTLARLVAADASQRLGQTMLVENRPGAGGNIAAQVVSKAKPDGYTLLEGNLSHAIAVTMNRKPLYDIVKDFAPIINLGAVPFVLCVNSASKIKTLADLIAAAKAQPDVLNYASSGVGGPSHLAMELFKMTAGVKLIHVPYKGAAPAVADLMGGRVDTGFLTIPAAEPMMRAGRLRALGVASLKRADGLPDVPTIAEQGFPGFEAATWFGVMAPAGTPSDIVAKLHDVFAAGLAVPETRKRLLEEGFEINGGTPQEFAAYIAAETAKWAPVVRFANAVPD